MSACVWNQWETLNKSISPPPNLQELQLLNPHIVISPSISKHRTQRWTLNVSASQHCSQHNNTDYSQWQTDYSLVWWCLPLEHSSISHSANLGAESTMQQCSILSFVHVICFFLQLHRELKYLPPERTWDWRLLTCWSLLCRNWNFKRKENYNRKIKRGAFRRAANTE